MLDRSLGGEDPLEKGMAYRLQYSCLENPMNKGVWQATDHGVAKSQIQLSDLAYMRILQSVGEKS